MKYSIEGRKIDILTGKMEKKRKEEVTPLPAKPTKIPKPTKIKSVPPRHKPKTKKKIAFVGKDPGKRKKRKKK